MNSPRRLRSGKRYTFLLLFASVLCGFVLLAYMRDGTSAVAGAAFSPILSVQRWLLKSSGSLPLYFRTRHSLIDEMQSLENQLRERDADAFTIRRLQTENADLSRLFGFRQDSRINASVLARPNQTPYDTFLIDRGTKDDIVEGAIVYIGGNIAVGVIVRTYAHSSLARLVSSSGVRATAYIFGPNIFTQTEGMGGGVLRVTVPQDIPLAVGDMVVLPAAGTGAYGAVVSVERVESNPEQYGYVTTPVPLQSMRFVSVAKEAVPDISYQTALEVVKSASSTLFSITVPDGVRVGTTTVSTSTGN